MFLYSSHPEKLRGKGGGRAELEERLDGQAQPPLSGGRLPSQMEMWQSLGAFLPPPYSQHSGEARAGCADLMGGGNQGHLKLVSAGIQQGSRKCGSTLSHEKSQLSPQLPSGWWKRGKKSKKAQGFPGQQLEHTAKTVLKGDVRKREREEEEEEEAGRVPCSLHQHNAVGASPVDVYLQSQNADKRLEHSESEQIADLAKSRIRKPKRMSKLVPRHVSSRLLAPAGRFP